MTRHTRRRAPRRARTTLAAGTALLAVAACGVGADPVMHPELSGEDVTITMNWWGADSRTQQTLDAIELFEQEHPNITVEPQYADWVGYWDRLATTTAAGDMPDVIQFDALYLASYAERGALLDLDTVSNILDTSALPDNLLASGEVNGDPYAVPIGGTTNGILINTSLFEEYGVELPDTSDWTWDEFTRAAADLTEASGGEVHGVSPFGSDSFSLTVWARQHGDDLFNADGEVALDPAIMTSYWQRVLDLIDAGAAPSQAEIGENLGLPLDQSSLVVGTSAMGFIPAGQFVAYQSAAPDHEYALADWPTDPDTVPGFQYPKPTMYWSAASTSSHPAEAALLIDFLTNDTRVARLFGLDRGEPGNPAFRDALQGQLDEPSQEALDFAGEMTGEIGDTPPITPNGASDIDPLQRRYYEQILFGESSPEDAAEGFLNELGDSITAAG